MRTTTPRLIGREHYLTKWNHLTGMIFGGGKARFVWRCSASATVRNDATGKKHPACGGANRLPGFVAALARYRASRGTPRLPGKPICRHQIDSIWSDSALAVLLKIFCVEFVGKSTLGRIAP
jgi:hypothetical protein